MAKIPYKATVEYRQVSRNYKKGDLVTDSVGNPIGVYVGDDKIMITGSFITRGDPVSFKKVNWLERIKNRVKVWFIKWLKR